MIKDLVAVRTTCALALPALSYLLFKFDIKYSDVKRASAHFDGEDYYWIEINEKYWDKLSISEKSFLLLHEVMHIFLLHHIRMIGCAYNKTKWNYATDYYINLILSGYYVSDSGKHDIDKTITRYLKMPSDGLFSTRYIGMSADDIYKLLPNDLNESNQFDEIMEVGDSGSVNKLKNDIAQVVVYGKNISSMIGNMEAGLLRSMSDLITPKIKWSELLKTNIDRSAETRYTYNKYNKLSDSVIFSSKTGEKVRVLFGVDTSGSMSDIDLKIAVGGIYEILNQIENWELILVTCDTKHHILGVYSSDNGDNLSNINKNFIGGGGTDMTPIIEYGNKLYLDGEIDMCLVYTDGEIPKIKVNFLCDTIFLITPTGKHFSTESTKTIKIEV